MKLPSLPSFPPPLLLLLPPRGFLALRSGDKGETSTFRRREREHENREIPVNMTSIVNGRINEQIFISKMKKINTGKKERRRRERERERELGEFLVFVSTVRATSFLQCLPSSSDAISVSLSLSLFLASSPGH